MNQILYSRNAQRTKIIFTILGILILIVLVFFSLGFINSKSGKILKGVHINDINIGDMTIEEAKIKLAEYQKVLDNKEYLLLYENREISISGDELDLEYQDELIDIAYAYGRTKNVFENSLNAWKALFNKTYNIDATFNINEVKLNEKINILLEEKKAVAIDDTYELSGENILLTKGHNGVTPKTEVILEKILATAGSSDVQEKVLVETNVEDADRIDFDELYKEFFVEKKNAECIQNVDGSVEYTKEIIGVSFDKALAESEYLNIADGETIKIALIEEKPEITTVNLDKVLFGDILATYKTQYNASNTDRSTNLEVAARNINGTILLPGEEFSYNKEVGQRTYANGFKDAHIFSGGKVVDGLGGGICQISSTLYNAVLMADLEIVERKNHMMYPEYVKPSLDATVVWGSIDFRFKNNRETPIKIVATVKNGIATTTIYGKKVEGEPIIEIQSVIEKTVPYTTVTEYDNTLEEGKTIVTQDPVNGYVSKAYRIEKDQNGKEISKTLISSDTYRQTSKIVTVGTKKVVKPIEPENNETDLNTGNNQENVQIEDNTENSSSEWPTGWDTPENPYYNGN